MDKEFQENDFLILIADDIVKNIQLLGKMLDNQGYRVVAVTESEKVLSAAEKHRPDLILLDIMMPGTSGFEVCRELKSREDLANIPVIFLTARAEKEDVIKGLNLGGADYVTKPFSAGELLARVETHLSLKRAREHISQQQQELQQLTATKEKLYSIIAHDLKGALFGVTGIAEILEQELEDLPVENEAKEYSGLILKSAGAANQILENMLVWTRLQTKNLEMKPESFSLSEEIASCVELYQTQASRKKIQIQVVFDIPEPEVTADKQMVTTVIRNLISNAIKFSNSGDQITINTTHTASGIQLSVADQGVGMPEEVRTSIFNPEERPKRTGTDNEGGTGLGLLLCKEFIEAHDGEIWVDSTPGTGSAFHISIPQQVLEM